MPPKTLLPGIDNDLVIPSIPHMVKENSSKPPKAMNQQIIEALEELKKCTAWQREAKGDQVIAKLSNLLPGYEMTRISTARSHWRDCGEGREELDGICNELIQKYRAAVQPRTFKQTLL